ncbi:MAG TPA: response regulator [Candidatus Paceibacterota bacterium]
MAGSKKILIVEDDIFLGDVLVKKLDAEGFTTKLARDGAVGLDDLRSFVPDLLLLDIILPTKSGYDVLSEKNQDPKIKDIPVIVISNSGQPVEINRALSLGVKDYLVKAQFDPDEVLNKVRNQLERGEKTRENGTSGVQLAGRKVMWVEDDKFLSDIISRKLHNEGCGLVHYTGGDEALAGVEQEMPDVILLDILLSGMDGFEILKRLKENMKVKHIPVILLSNLGQKSDIDKGRELGAEKFLIKASMNLDEIVTEIKHTIRSA